MWGMRRSIWHSIWRGIPNIVLRNSADREDHQQIFPVIGFIKIEPSGSFFSRDLYTLYYGNLLKEDFYYGNLETDRNQSRGKTLDQPDSYACGNICGSGYGNTRSQTGGDGES